MAMDIEKFPNIQVGMITKLFMATETTTIDWWLDSSITIHVCNNKEVFKNYEDIVERREMLMVNSNAAKFLGQGS